MPIDSLHPVIKASLPTWNKCHAVAEGGEEYLKDPQHARTFLPPLAGHVIDARAYQEFLQGNHLYNATSRVLSMILGLLFRKPGTFKWPSVLGPFMEDVTGAEEDFEAFSEGQFSELFKAGGVAVLTDYPKVDENEAGRLTVEQVERRGLRPFWTQYDLRSVVNFWWERRGFRRELRGVVVRETALQPGKDEFERKEVEQYRMFDLDPAGDYRQRVFQRVKDQKTGKVEWRQVGPPIYPRAGGRYLRHVPFRFLGRGIRSGRPKPPDISALVDANLTHWRVSALYYSGLCKIALPQFYTAGEFLDNDRFFNLVDYMAKQGMLLGADPEAILKSFQSENMIRLGVDYALQFKDPTGHAGFAEFTGQGMEALRLALQDLRQEMVTQGARILATDKLAAETADAERTRRADSNSILEARSRLLSADMRGPVYDALVFLGAESEQFELAYNVDFFDGQLTGDEALKYLDTHLTGGIPLEDLYHLYKRGEILRPDLSYPQYKAALTREREDRAASAVLLPEDEDEDEDGEDDDTTPRGAEEEDGDGA